MICKYCGMKQPDNAKTCHYCGRKLSGSKKKILLWVLVAVLVAELGLAGWFMVGQGQDRQLYAQAQEYVKQGQYDQAVQLFRQLGDYEDSQAQLAKLQSQQADYDEAIQLMEQGDYTGSAELLSKLAGYRDSDSILAQQIPYRQAVALLEEGKFEETLQVLQSLGDYQDSEALEKECYYSMGLLAAQAADQETLELCLSRLDAETAEKLNREIEAQEQQAQELARRRQEADALLSAAQAKAAGYDYRGAMELLNSFAYKQDFPEFAQKLSEYEQLDASLVSYPHMDKITHIFFHSLIVDPSRCFDGEATDAGYNQYMTTCDEFWAMMESMYQRGFVLVSPYDVAYEVTDSAGTRFVYGDIRLPEGKTPFLMSQDDLNYYGYMIGGKSGVNEVPVYANTRGDGFAHRIVIGEDGFPTCEYMDKQGNVTTGDYDLVPLLEKFIQEHPDFSYHGARAILGMTGYEGVFGYRTKPSYENTIGSERYAQEVEQAKAVAQCLRDHGWILASHSYGHPAYGNISAQRVAADSDKWENTVQPIIGDCDIILYPHGSDIAGGEKYTFSNQKFKALYEDGYRYFFNVDSSVYWTQLGDNYYRAGRRNLDGYRMYYHPHKLDDLFVVAEVFDKARPTPVPPI